jgi:cytochrome d ubiquinol oxidase subunit II
MTAAAAVGGILLASVTLYAVLGGADFGGGLWDLLAGGDRRGQEARRLIDESISPVWEANHVWLIFDLVIFGTGFPHAFAAVMTAVPLPLWLALAGIVLRGAGFAFRKELSRPSLQRVAGAAFAFASLLTPFFMGAVIGAIATGSIPASAGHASLAAWTSPTALLTGCLFVAACSYLAAVYLTGEAARDHSQRLQLYFTRRAVAALGVAAVVWGWGVAQYPVLLPRTTVTLANAGAPQATFDALIVLSAAALLLIGPSFALLYNLQGRRLLGGEAHLPRGRT